MICSRQMFKEARNIGLYKSYIGYCYCYMSSKAFGMLSILYSANFYKAVNSLTCNSVLTNIPHYWHTTNIPWHYMSYT